MPACRLPMAGVVQDDGCPALQLECLWGSCFCRHKACLWVSCWDFSDIYVKSSPLACMTLGKGSFSSQGLQIKGCEKDWKCQFGDA